MNIWVACRELAVGDTLLCEDGTWVGVEGVRDTGRWESVYNLRVADHHTYFVGTEDWGFSVWVHNACVNIALGLDAGLKTFAQNHKAKWYKEWKAEMFGLPPNTSWDPENTRGGTNSPFASAFRSAVEGSNQIYFNLAGVDLSAWLPLNWTPKTGPAHKVEFGVDARAGTGGHSWRGSVGC